jgi:hypothetical protein
VDANKKQITLSITFPDGTPINVSLDITIYKSVDVQLAGVYFNEVIPSLAEWINGGPIYARVSELNTPQDAINLIFNDFLRPSSDITRRVYGRALGKSLGDITQEFNGCLKMGGYREVPAYKGGAVPPIARHTIEGHVDRLTIANDQPSAARIIWMLRCLPDGMKNMNAFGGFWNPSRQILCSAANRWGLGTLLTGGKRRRTRRRKRKRRPTRRRKRRKKRTRRRRRGPKRRTKRR